MWLVKLVGFWKQIQTGYFLKDERKTVQWKHFSVHLGLQIMRCSWIILRKGLRQENFQSPLTHVALCSRWDLTFLHHSGNIYLSPMLDAAWCIYMTVYPTLFLLDTGLWEDKTRCPGICVVSVINSYYMYWGSLWLVIAYLYQAHARLFMTFISPEWQLQAETPTGLIVWMAEGGTEAHPFPPSLRLSFNSFILRESSCVRHYVRTEDLKTNALRSPETLPSHRGRL